MPKQLLMPMLLACGLTIAVSAQELALSTTAKTYNTGEQVWVNLSVLDAGTMPGAYKIEVSYDASKLNFLTTLPAEKGPFAITPAASANGGTVTVAGFQGIVDSGQGAASLVTLVFTPTNGDVVIDTTSFTIGSKEVFSAQAQAMDLRVTKQTSSVLLPSSGRALRRDIMITGNYIRFTVLNEGITSVRIFDLKGRTIATPLPPSRLKTGNHGVPLGRYLRSGIYIIAVRGVGLTATKRLEVVR